MSNQGFRSQSFDAETRARLRVVASSPGIARAKQEAELRRRVEDWRARKDRPQWGAIIVATVLAVYLVAFVACVAYIFASVR